MDTADKDDLGNQVLNLILVLLAFSAVVVFFNTLFSDNDQGGPKIEDVMVYTSVLIAVLSLLVTIWKRENTGFLVGGFLLIGGSLCVAWLGMAISPATQLDKCLRYAYENPINSTMRDFYRRLLYEDKTDVRFGDSVRMGDNAALQEFFWKHDGEEKSISCAVP